MWYSWWWPSGVVSTVINLTAPSISLPWTGWTGAKMLGEPMKGNILTLPSSRPWLWLSDLMSGKPRASLKRLEISTAFWQKRPPRQGRFLIFTNSGLPVTGWPGWWLTEGIMLEVTTRRGTDVCASLLSKLAVETLKVCDRDSSSSSSCNSTTIQQYDVRRPWLRFKKSQLGQGAHPSHHPQHLLHALNLSTPILQSHSRRPSALGQDIRPMIGKLI